MPHIICEYYKISVPVAVALASRLFLTGLGVVVDSHSVILSVAFTGAMYFIPIYTSFSVALLQK